MYKEFRDKSGRLCHVVFHPEIGTGRTDITSSQHLLQIATIAPENGASFAAHRHVPKQVESSFLPTLESWIVVQGNVTVYYYDVEGVPLGSHRLGQGDVTLTYEGGHSYGETVGLVAVEFKSGPYLGQEKDKVFI